MYIAPSPDTTNLDASASAFNSGNELFKAKRFNDFYLTCSPYSTAAWYEQDTDYRFCFGDQAVWASYYGNLPLSRRKNYNFNRILRIKNMITGYQRKNRKSTIVVPTENGDAETCDQLTKIMMWNDQQEGIPETISDAFEGAVITGWNLLQAYMDFTNDPISGDIKVDRVNFNSFCLDPFTRRRDLADCRGLIRRTYLTKESILSLLPDAASEIRNMKSNMLYDDKFPYMPERFAVNPRDLLSYDEYYYKTTRTQDLLIDTQTGETKEWNGGRGKDSKDQLRHFLQTYPSVILSTNQISTVNLMILVQGMVLSDGPNPTGIDDYNFVPVMSYYNPEMSDYSLRIQGVVRSLRDAQFLYNRRRIIELDTLEAQLSSGYIYKVGTLVDDNDIFLTGNGKGLAVKPNANIADIVPIQAPVIPPTSLEIRESMGKEMQDVSGVSEELLGSADSDTGITTMLKQGAGLTTLHGIFDNLDYAQKMLGRIRLRMIQANFTPGKIKRIINEEPTHEFYNKMFSKYDAAVEEGVNTTTQRQLCLAQLLDFRKLGIMIPDETIIENMTIQNKKQLIEKMQQNQQQQMQIQQQQMQSEQRLQQAQTQLANARATADTGLGYERMSRIEENKALGEERHSKAILDAVKAMAELEHLDIDAVHKFVTMQHMMRQQDREISQANVSKVPKTPKTLKAKKSVPKTQVPKTQASKTQVSKEK